MTEQALHDEIVAIIPRLRRFARGLTGNQQDADDLVQVSLEKALSRLHQYTPGTRLDSWLYRIVQTSFLDERRRSSRREDTMSSDALERLPGAGRGVEADNEARLADIDRALATLPQEQRTVVVSVLVEGNSYRDAADMLGLPIGTVMSRLSRARKALAVSLGEANR